VPFSSLLFIHVFLPAFLLAYWATPRAAKNWTAIAASLVFYGWGAPRFLPVVVGLGVVDYAVSHQLAAVTRPRLKRALLIVGVTIHLSVLAYFKYSNFLVGELDGIVGKLGYAPLAWTHVVLPIGISFITFEEISYLTDVYRGDARPARRLSYYLLFLTLFPHAIAGPIFRWKDLDAQLAERSYGWTLVREGFERFARGLAKKVLVADSVAIIADSAFSAPTGQLTTSFAWLGAIGYAIQIYFDFSGYSDMAIGLGKMIGFRFKENFNQPYISASITEFWARWHISLSTWLRDYLYIPLGGNRRGERRTIMNLMIVFALSGLWHGAAWTFVIWGVFHGSLVAAERLLGPRRERIPVAVQHVVTLVLLVIGWVIFRAASAGQALDVIRAMFGLGSAVEPPPVAGDAMPRHAMLALIAGTVIVLAPLVTRYRGWRPRVPAIGHVLARVGYFALFALAAIHLTNMRITPLIYFKF
jgi:alginate O-acetyltransferase complex protein AlgI